MFIVQTRLWLKKLQADALAAKSDVLVEFSDSEEAPVGSSRGREIRQ